MDKSKLKDILKKNKKLVSALKFVMDHARYFTAGALFLVMVIVLATCAGPDAKSGGVGGTEITAETEEAYQVNSYEAVNTLINQYYTAYAAGDIATLTSLATPVSANEQSYITLFSQYVDEYQNVQCYTKSGLDANSYLVSVAMEIKFSGVNTSAPGLDFFYVRTNSEGALYIDNLYSNYNLLNQENALDTSVQNLILEFENESDVIALQQEVQNRYDVAVAADESLSNMIYTTIPNAISQWVTQVTAQNAQTQVPVEGTEAAGTENADPEVAVEGEQVAEESEQVSEVEPEIEQEEVVAEQETVYTRDRVNVREEANTGSDKLGTVNAGTSLVRIGTEGEWSKVEYNGGTGYIKSEFLEVEDAQENSNDVEDGDEEATDDEATVSFAEGTVITLKSAVNIRSGMSEDADRIGTAYKGEKVKVVMSYAEGWTKVTWDGETGYIKSSLLQ